MIAVLVYVSASKCFEGNTLTQSETELVLEMGITIGGKTLREHLEVIGHKDAIDYIELAQQGTPIGEWEIKQIHNLILRAISPDEVGRYRQLDVRAAGTEYVYPPHYLLNDLMADANWLSSPEAMALHQIVEAQQQKDSSQLLMLILDAAQRALIELLTILSTAQESRGRGLAFYEEMLAFLSNHRADT